MAIPALRADETEARDTRIRHNKEQWARFDAWMRKRGHTSLAEGLRAAINLILELDNNDQSNSDTQSASG